MQALGAGCFADAHEQCSYWPTAHLTIILITAGLFSIEILAMCPGGGWRTLSEWKAMFAKHSYQLEDTKLVGANMSLMVWGLSH